MPSIGPWELGIIAFVFVMVFGVGKLPELGGALGKSIREFRKATSELTAAKSEFTAATSGALGEGGHGSAGQAHTVDSAQPGAGTARVCPRCGAGNAPANAFCGRCGRGLG